MTPYRVEILTQENWKDKPAIYEAGYGVIALCYDKVTAQKIVNALNVQANQ